MVLSITSCNTLESRPECLGSTVELALVSQPPKGESAGELALPLINCEVV